MSQEDENTTYTLITGTTSGLGKEFANTFAKNGHNLVTVGLEESLLAQQKQELENQYHISVKYIVKDLSADSSTQEIYDEIQSDGIVVDTLINNAGFGTFGRFVDVPWEKQKALAMVDMMAVMHLSYLFGGDMAKRGSGMIINIASIASFEAGPYMAMYYAAKAFVRSLTESLHEELKSSGVSVTTICPGPTLTNFEKNAEMKNSNMFTKMRTMTAEQVVAESYKAAMQHKAVHVVGFSNRLIVFLTRFVTLRHSRLQAMRVNIGDGKKSK